MAMKDFNACGTDAQDRRVIPANTKRKPHVYLDLRVGGRIMRREGSFMLFASISYKNIHIYVLS